MPIIRPWQNPTTKDYIVELGSPREDKTHASDVYRRIATQRGSVPTLPTFGSRLHTVTHIQKNTKRLVESYIREAIADLVASRAIRDVVITVTVGAATIEATVDFTDRSGAQDAVAWSQAVGAGTQAIPGLA